MAGALALYSLYLPLNDNDGKPFPRERLDWAKGEILRFAGGCTFLPVGDGLWFSPGGRLHRDRVMPVLVVAPLGGDTVSSLGRLVGRLARELNQEEIFVHYTPVSILEAGAHHLELQAV